MRANEDKIEAKMGAKTDDKFVKAPMGNSKALKEGNLSAVMKADEFKKKMKVGGSTGLVKDKGDEKFIKDKIEAPKGKVMNKEMKSGGKVDEAKMEKKFMKDDAKSDKKQDKALEKKIEKKDDKEDARTMKKHEAKEKDEPKMKKGGDVKAHKYGKKAHHYAEGGSVGFACMPKMMSSMGKVNKERDE